MTILYKPVKIESAAQAEALPEGTIATHDEHWPVVRCTPNRWESSARDMEHAEMIGWTALVSVETEEYHSEDYGSYHLMEAIDGTKPFTAYLVDQEEA